LIGHSHRFAFIHVPKTGGTSIEEVLRGEGIVLQGPGNLDSVCYKHATAAAMRRMLGEEFATYYRFSVIRNPLDWAVSNYAFNRGLARPWVIGTSYRLSGRVPEWAADQAFGDWLRWWVAELSPSQACFVTDEEGELLLDDLFCFEDLPRCMSSLRTRFGLPELPLPHLKRTPGRSNYTQYFDSESVAFAERAFAKDFEIWRGARSIRPTEPAA